MSVPDKITIEYLKECFAYRPETGHLWWRDRPLTHFKTEREWRRWNTRYAWIWINHDDLTSDYVKIKLHGHSFGVHIISWSLFNNRLPNGVIDHINGDTRDNRISNLREATRAQNGANSKVRKNNKLNVKGVGIVGKKYRAVIYLKGKSKHLGYFNTAKEANDAYLAASTKIHGEFAKAG